MSENKTIVIDPSTTALLIFVFLMIITFWGEPDLLDLILMRLAR